MLTPQQLDDLNAAIHAICVEYMRIVQETIHAILPILSAMEGSAKENIGVELVRYDPRLRKARGGKRKWSVR